MGNKSNGANQAGQNAEAMIKCVLDMLKKKGYSPVTQFVLTQDKLLKEPIFSENSRADFLVRQIPGFESGLIIESKWQDSQGTTTKGCYYDVVYLIKRCYPYPAILVAAGAIYSMPRVKRWLLSEVDNQKLIAVFFSFEELITWANNVSPVKPKSELKAMKTLPLFELGDYER